MTFFAKKTKKTNSLFVVDHSVDHVFAAALHRLVQEGRVALVQHQLGPAVQQQLHGGHVSLPGGDVQRGVLVYVRAHDSPGLTFCLTRQGNKDFGASCFEPASG